MVEATLVVLHLRPRQDRLEIRARGYDGEGKLAWEREFREVKQLFINAPARASPQVGGGELVLVVENARVLEEEGVLRVGE